MRRSVRITLQLLVSGGIIAYLLWQIDVGQTVDLIASANGWYLLGALAIFLVTTVGLAWRWGTLLRAKGIREPLSWLTGAYFVGYAAGQVLPTSLGGDAVRIFDHSRRRPDHVGEAAGAVLMERILGAAGTLTMVAIGLAVAIGRYDDIEPIVALEIFFIALVVAGFVLLFSKRAGRLLSWLGPLSDRLGLGTAARSLYDAMHGYRQHVHAMVVVWLTTVGIQFLRILAIWMCGKSVGVDISPLVYVVLGPLLFLVMMVPFTINGLGVREAFFVAFLTQFDVSADAAFATGFLFYVVTLATAIPGAIVIAWRAIHPAVDERLAARSAHPGSANGADG